MAKKVEKKDNSKINIIIVVALVAVVVVSLALLVPSLTKKDPKKEEKKETNEKIEVTEKTISEEYGFTKDDAIKAVKKIYNSDNYSFEAEVRNDNMYIVTVTNTDTNESQKYLVDPNDGTFSLLDEE